MIQTLSYVGKICDVASLSPWPQFSIYCMVVKFEIDDEEGLMAEQLPASPKHIGLGHTTSSKVSWPRHPWAQDTGGLREPIMQ